MGLVDLLLTPDRFFREQEGVSGLIIPALIVGIVGVLSAIGAYYVSQVTIEAILPALPSGTEQFMSITLIFSVIGGILGPYFLWLVATAVFYGISALFRGKGNFGKCLQFIGYGFLPQIFGGLINIYLYYEFANTVEIPRITDPTLITQVTQSFIGNPYFDLTVLVGIIFLIWSANIWIHGLRYARHLEMRDAAISVIVPVGIYILYMLYSTGSLGY